MAAFERTVNDGDRLLIEGLCRNDAASMAAVYDAHAGIAYGLALRVLGGAADAEDVVQESFLALWRQAERLDPARSLRSYLLTIVHNKAVDRLRRRGRLREAAIEGAATIPAAGADPETAAEQLSDRQVVRQAMQSLPPEQRQAVALAYIGGLTINDIAARTNVPAGTVKSRLRLALERMRREIGGRT
jgi:RNA polymerase sigma-70 factor (ECF subfamily)